MMETAKNIVSGKEETTNEIERGPLYLAKVIVENIENEYGKKDAFETVRALKEMPEDEVEGEIHYVGFETETDDSAMAKSEEGSDYDNIDIDFGDGEETIAGKDIKVYALIICRSEVLKNIRKGIFKDGKFLLSFRREPGDKDHPITELPKDTKYWAYFE